MGDGIIVPVEVDVVNVDVVNVAAVVVSEVVPVAVGDEEEVEVVVSVTVPITQYAFVISSPGQIIPGFSLWRSSTESPQLLAKVAHVSPVLAVVSNPQSTARDEIDVAARTETMSPAVKRMCLMDNMLRVKDVKMKFIMLTNQDKLGKAMLLGLGSDTNSLSDEVCPYPFILLPIVRHQDSF